MYRPLKVTFHLDGTGLYYDPAEPIMLDGLIALACARRQMHGDPPGRDEPPQDYMLPLKRWHMGGTWGWHASALFPEGPTVESITYWRKRFRQHRVEITDGSPNLRNGIYRDWNMPLPLLLTLRMVGWCVLDTHFMSTARLRKDLRDCIRWLGKKRAYGRGCVVDVDVEHTDEDFSIVRDGKLTRWMPREDGTQFVRPRPPYWNIVGRVRCAEIGEDLHINNAAPMPQTQEERRC